ncbi:MAG: flagellar motor switch protein FliN [Bacteriovoracaceae bacterium]|nr:flagellar motor switch protein FliN [Bacteriovoracaceae bacterium]
MENETNNEGPLSNVDPKDLHEISNIADNVQAGDDALNKLKVQNLDFILDIPLKVTVELGRTSVVIKDLLQLGQGSVLELDKLAGEPLEILVNGKLVAKGEVVVVNEKFGIRLTDIISPVERIETLK